MKEVHTQFFTFAENPSDPFRLQGGDTLSPVTVAYECYGTLSENKDNAILLFHALSGSQHAAGFNPAVQGVDELWTDECRTGWWDEFIGPGKALDTNRFFVICANYLGSCYGSTGPRSVNPATGRPYGGDFPKVTFNDIVDTQVRLLDHLGIESLHAAIGGSLGGMAAINLAARYPARVRNVVPIASGINVTILQRIQNLEQICAIEEDANFNNGHYYEGSPPLKGLILARMIAHKTYVSLHMLERRAREKVVQPDEGMNRYKLSHPVESYMLHQGQKFVSRFDANSYLRITEAWQRFDLVQDTNSSHEDDIFAACKNQHFLVFSIDSDVSFYTDQQAELVFALKRKNVPVQHITVHSDKGHDAFLLEPNLFTPHLMYILSEQW